MLAPLLTNAVAIRFPLLPGANDIWMMYAAIMSADIAVRALTLLTSGEAKKHRDKAQ